MGDTPVPTFTQLSTTTANLGFAITIALFLVFMLAVLVVWQMRDLRLLQERHARERSEADIRHGRERAEAENRHGNERAEWRQTQAALLARFAEAQEKERFDLVSELKQQTRYLERLVDRAKISITEDNSMKGHHED